ncbi:MAG: transglutaminase domain-containing protein [Methyloprofundus sp.]|nr:transglutaminase domain-containing protein [Methyloprofundus sp.]
MTITVLNSPFKKSLFFRRSIASLVIVAHLMLVTSPAIAAVTAGTHLVRSKVGQNAEAELASLFAEAVDKLALLQKLREDNQDSTGLLVELKNLSLRIEQLNQTILDNFTLIAKAITEKQLPDTIMQRHIDMVAHYKTQYNAFADLLAQEIGTGFVARVERKIKHFSRETTVLTNDERVSHIHYGKYKFSHNDFKRSQQQFNPSELGDIILQADERNKPKTTREEFIQSGLDNSPKIRLAALGDFTFDQLTGADNPAYLAATDEVLLTQSIKDKARELNYDPVKIYHWVRNNIVWQPTWGAMQNAEHTLSAGRGNAMDIASLTIALLRAAKIPARYVHGSIDVPRTTFNNWAGGFEDISAAVDFASANGIPIVSVVSGGQVSKIRLEHVWVEAAIDYFPSRGAKNKAADTWLALDASYKQYEYLTGLDPLKISGQDPEQRAQSFINSGTLNEAESWGTGFDNTVLQAAQTKIQTKLQAYITDNITKPSLANTIGGRKTIIKDYPSLSSGLPYQIQFSGQHYDKLPRTLQQTITWGLSKDIFGNPNDPITFPFTKVNNQKITLAFEPATEDDELALEALVPEQGGSAINQLPNNIPGYLIQVMPVLKLNGETLKTGAAMSLGEELDFVTIVSYAGRGQQRSPRNYKVIAGSYLAVNVYAGSVAPQILDKILNKLKQTREKLASGDDTQINTLGREEILGDVFHLTGLNYYAQLTALSHIVALQAGAHNMLIAGLGILGYEPKVNYLFGLPRSISTGSIVLDIPLVHTYATNNGDLEAKKQFVLQIGMLSSALEHHVPEQLFANEDNSGAAISAVKALQMASIENQRIYRINSDNQATSLANIHHEQVIINEIKQAIAVGKEVIIHSDVVSVAGWRGAGYIITDPVTGASAYKISGGLNGGDYSDSDKMTLFFGAVGAGVDITLLLRNHGNSGGLSVIEALDAMVSSLVTGVVNTAATVGSTEPQRMCLTESQGAVFSDAISSVGDLSWAARAFAITNVNAPVQLAQYIAYIYIALLIMHFVDINMALEEC